MRSSGWLLAMALLGGCAAGGATGSPALSLPIPVVDTEARPEPEERLGNGERLSRQPPSSAVSQTSPIEPASPTPAAEPAVGARAPESARGDEDTKDPFNSQSVDHNREGSYIIERVLTMPEPDPAGD